MAIPPCARFDHGPGRMEKFSTEQVHAYLHRKEGDEGNAGYWYRRAGRPPYAGSLDDEWEAIARALLG